MTFHNKLALFCLAFIALIICGLMVQCAFIDGVKQSNNDSPSGQLWLVSYVCYEKGEPDSIGCAVEVASSAKAARDRFNTENIGQVCKITNVEQAKR
jgi:hypothetical protein